MSNEAFEKWAMDYGLDYESSFTRDDVEASWQAAKADSEQEIIELQAHINDLREALEENHYSNSTEKAIKLYKEALSKTPAQSLQGEIK